MVPQWKNIQWWWFSGSKTIEKPLIAMVPSKKIITIPSLWKNDHRWSLQSTQERPALAWARVHCQNHSNQSQSPHQKSHESVESERSGSETISLWNNGRVFRLVEPSTARMHRRVASTVQLWSPESITREGRGNFWAWIRIMMRMTMSKSMTIIMSISISLIRGDKIMVLRCLESVGNVGLQLEKKKKEQNHSTASHLRLPSN